jgi:hypothetical protein
VTGGAIMRAGLVGLALWCSIGSVGYAQDTVLDVTEVGTTILGRPLISGKGEVFTFDGWTLLIKPDPNSTIRMDAELRRDGRLCGRMAGIVGKPPQKCFSFRRGSDGSLALCQAIDAGCYDSFLLGLPRSCFDGVPKCQAVRLN